MTVKDLANSSEPIERTESRGDSGSSLQGVEKVNTRDLVAQMIAEGGTQPAPAAKRASQPRKARATASRGARKAAGSTVPPGVTS